MPCLLRLAVKTPLFQGAQIAPVMQGVVSPENALLWTATAPASPRKTRQGVREGWRQKGGKALALSLFLFFFVKKSVITKSIMKIQQKKYVWEVDLLNQEPDDLQGAERFGGKKRSELKDSDFLDPKRRSFPVMSCKDVKDAVSAWGMYKGSMSFDEFKSKLTSRAKKLGCEGSLPDKWVKGAKTKKEWDKIDKKELDRDSKKEKGEHEKDAIKDDQDKIKKLKKGKPSEKKSVMVHDLKKDEKFDKKDKTATSKKGLPPWLKKDKKEDKKDGKKGDKKDDKKEEGKNGKKLPPWLNKKKSKSTDYSDLYKKVSNKNK